MKRASIVLLLFICFRAAAQTELPVDGQKITFSNVVKTDTLKKELLYQNLKTWFISNHFTLQDSAKDARLVAVSEFPVYARGYISKKLHGKISYTVTVEVKDYKYRYFFTDFVFAYYKEDRYYDMKPTGKTKPLEEPKAAGWQSQWEHYKQITKNTVETYISQLAVAAVQPPVSSKPLAASKKVKAPAEEW